MLNKMCWSDFFYLSFKRHSLLTLKWSNTENLFALFPLGTEDVFSVYVQFEKKFADVKLCGKESEKRVIGIVIHE